MTVLWSPTWTRAADFRVNRAQIKGFAIGWWDGAFVEYGRTTIIQEIPYGGYRVVFTFLEDFWNENNKEWRLEGIFDDAYALAPGSTTPVSMGPIEINLNWQDLCNGYLLILALPSAGNVFFWQEYQPLSYDYWAKNTLPWKREPPFKNVT